MTRDPQLYEIGFLIKPDLPAEKAAEVLGEIRSYVEKNGGMPDRTTDAKLRPLAYPIQKFTQAYFGALQFMVAPEALSAINKDVEAHTAIIRHLTLAWEQEPERSIIQSRPTKQKSTTANNVLEKPPVTSPAPSPTTHEDVRPEEEKVSEEEIDKKLDEILGS
ncbi:MAG: 30S ribosomal protein S6 [Candidatus Ryanbacteria bacterium CG10_big_fil_rev_8_21_14_0_10_43_42]|uniref:Small ribosomal subunit protein bS6 n=1 Tax=Candidatus Ryanbacteria bacterium CG10_big_fil_rev_8_21_14_0_10_43_42 TaxID=1974864 RepID=A0A2M8KWV5_9BACT|nr:MAG: 30S ribosomal protein S6 [Candidatus Ryanbacteria bacterium CG10_big_fil_rev_8_21_14_0_10_43_42]